MNDTSTLLQKADEIELEFEKLREPLLRLLHRAEQLRPSSELKSLRAAKRYFQAAHGALICFTIEETDGR